MKKQFLLTLIFFISFSIHGMQKDKEIVDINNIPTLTLNKNTNEKESQEIEKRAFPFSEDIPRGIQNIILYQCIPEPTEDKVFINAVHHFFESKEEIPNVNYEPAFLFHHTPDSTTPIYFFSPTSQPSIKKVGIVVLRAIYEFMIPPRFYETFVFLKTPKIKIRAALNEHRYSKDKESNAVNTKIISGALSMDGLLAFLHKSDKGTFLSLFDIKEIKNNALNLDSHKIEVKISEFGCYSFRNILLFNAQNQLLLLTTGLDKFSIKVLNLPKEFCAPPTLNPIQLAKRLMIPTTALKEELKEVVEKNKKEKILAQKEKELDEFIRLLYL